MCLVGFRCRVALYRLDPGGPTICVANHELGSLQGEPQPQHSSDGQGILKFNLLNAYRWDKISTF
jgi:hypothetical protein